VNFPVSFALAGHRVPAHLVFEILAYAVGARIYFRSGAGARGLEPSPQLAVLAGCVLGALAGAKILAWAENPDLYWGQRGNPAVWLQGKTIVGGILGGWAGVEIAKRHLGITRPTGDPFVLPLALGIAIGRIGCFLTGLDDRTYGTATTLPWGVDFGDGVLRHPTQLYETAFLLLFALSLPLLRPRFRRGELFLLFVSSYLAFRFAVEFLKPRFHPYLGLSMIQLASLAGIGAALVTVAARRRSEPAGLAEASHA
jgi:phosphatidylglycerol:prolipoprotein diacylglycerol transferase